MAPKTDNTKLHPSDIWANVGCLVIVILFAAWGIVFYNGVNNNIHRGTLDVHMQASYKNGIVTLTNKEKYNLKFLWFSLDTDKDPATYEYDYYLTEMDGKTTISLDLSNFTRNNIEHFDPVSMTPRHLSVFADTSPGIGHFIYTFPYTGID
jgi:hypothetical protein